MKAKEKTNNINSKDELMKMIITIEKIASFILFGYFVMCYFGKTRKSTKNTVEFLGKSWKNLNKLVNFY